MSLIKNIFSCQKLILQAEQSAVFVAVIDMNAFKDFKEHLFRLFVTYNITAANSKKYPLQLLAGEIKIDPSKFYDSNNEIYKNMKHGKIAF